MKKNNGGKPQGENKYIRSDRSAKETAFKNIEIIPLQSCSLLINNTHADSQTYKLTTKAVGEVMTIITLTLLMTGWKIV